ncbi:thiamine phosphate synthase [Campylobacter sp. MIT 21-1685]|uniref:thiamine phosphate synthase n=1 Tax=unclassified Campylobacter TaxID=2593542 RepID=UPI00224A727F|nr:MULTISPECIES: thiamine phosphate synthase [unclassified Campylobacter]MCX2682397.1 thiamine phosphate synthase [Campylobacter sp. MIT 21-1684]MCX2750677.1 thiamine phosphate synthase [Campylobacter sp. MIT 21-1682]MCX2806775.1 thiamine phosphate synthase [Campylobacter sp. MIT 21-1685]
MLDLTLYLVATKLNKQSDENFLNTLEEALRGGVSIIQLREKTLNSRDFYLLALKVKKLCDTYTVPFIINDRVDIALACEASGVHLGQEDLPVKEARKILGREKIIGLSLKKISQLKDCGGADYLGCGAIKASATKKESEIIPLEDLREIITLSPLPVVAIGGIDESVVKQMNGLNLAGIAVIRAIMNAKSPYKAALNLRKIFETNVHLSS